MHKYLGTFSPQLVARKSSSPLRSFLQSTHTVKGYGSTDSQFPSGRRVLAYLMYLPKSKVNFSLPRRTCPQRERHQLQMAGTVLCLDEAKKH